MNAAYSFRIDDVSVNTDADKLRKMVNFLVERFQHTLEITLAVSPAVHDTTWISGLQKERVFPRMLHTESDFRAFYGVQKIGIPDYIFEFRMVPRIYIASHGFIHIDHRLLSKKAQEMSILTSCSLLMTKTFVPPFHKWNRKTEEVCNRSRIELVKFVSHRDKHLLYHPFSRGETSYYFHTHDFTYEQFVGQFP